MARSKLYEYAILYHPKATKEDKDAGVSPKSEILTPPTTCLGVDDREVGIRAARTLDEKYLDKLEDVEIIVRPF